MNEIEPLCRLCANSTNVVNSINLFHPNQRKLLEQIEELTTLQLRNTNDLPQLICSLCQKQILQAHEFRERCIQVQEHFLTTPVLRNQEPTHEPVLYEITILRDESEDLLPHGAIMHIKPEEPSFDDSFNLLSKLSNQLTEHMQATEPKESLFVKEQTMFIEEDYIPPLQKHKSDAKTLHTKKKKKRFNIEDECEITLTYPSQFKTDLRQHNGCKPFECYLCQRVFTSKSQMQHHIRNHSIEKPFPCRYCDHRLWTASTRDKHERTHTNKQRFPCQDCYRSFSNRTDLKRHGVIHTGERPFECTFCNISFGFTKHLKQHQDTKKHKINEAKYQQMAIEESAIHYPTIPITTISAIQN